MKSSRLSRQFPLPLSTEEFLILLTHLKKLQCLIHGFIEIMSFSDPLTNASYIFKYLMILLIRQLIDRRAQIS